MARTPLFAAVAALSLFACDADEEIAGDLRSHDHGHGHGHGHHVGHPGHAGHHGIPGRIGKKKDQPIYPSKDWKTGAPEDHCLSREVVAGLTSDAAETTSSCLAVYHDGLLVGDWYWNGFVAKTPIPDVWSVTKACTSSVIGIAQAEGM